MFWAPPGSDLSASNPLNWIHDDNGWVTNELPGPGDVVYLGGAYPYSDCEELPALGGGEKYWGILVGDNYTGTVTLADGVAAEQLWLCSGQVEALGSVEFDYVTLASAAPANGLFTVASQAEVGNLAVYAGQAAFLGGGEVGTAQLWAGLVSLGADTEFDTLHVIGGDLLQSAAADMTVTEQFVWTDGDINAAGNTAALIISGAAGSVAPVDAGTVAIGSTLNVVEGAFVEFEVGTISFEGGDGVYVENATVQAKSKDEYAYAKIANVGIGDRRFVVGTNASYHVVREGTAKEGLHHTALPIEVTDKTGKFSIDGAIDVTVTGQLGVNGPSVSSKGLVHIAGGSALRVPNGISLSGGELLSSYVADSTKATIVGNLVNDGAKVHMSSAAGVLRVEGDVTWNSGVYVARVTAGEATYRDLWEATGKFTFGANAQVQPLPAFTPGVGESWVVLSAGKGFGGGPPGTIAPESGVGTYGVTLGMNEGVLRRNA